MRLILTVAVLEFVCKYASGISSQCDDPSDNWHFRGNNIALNMLATQIPNTQQSFIYPANKAVDGNCDGDTYDHSCSHTDSNRDTAPTWTVQLGQPYQITGVIIYNRIDLRERLKNFKIICNYNKTRNTTLYDDAKQPQHVNMDTIIQIELDGTHSCSSISVQIPQFVYSVGFGFDYAYLTLCEVQIYTVGCTRPSTTNGAIYPDKKWYTQHESLTVTCSPGYRLSSPTSTFTCCGYERFCEPVPQCERVYCQIPANPDNGYYKLPDNVMNQKVWYGGLIEGKCNIGYKSNIINTIRTCQINGTWSGTDTVCLPVKCPPLENITHGHYLYDNNIMYIGGLSVYNTTLVGGCAKGYKLRSQARNIRCDHNGHWTGTTPSCDIVTCTQPDKFMNGHYASIESQNTYPYKYEITAVCDQGFKLASSTQIRICNDEGSWSGYSPICLEMKCPWPLNLPGGFYIPSGVEHSDNVLPVNTTLEAACNDGYILKNTSDDIHVRCMEDGRWSPATIICSKKAANVDSNPEHLSQEMIVGVSVTVVIMLVVVVVVVIFVYHRRRVSKKRAEEANYITPTHNPSEGEYDELQETSYEQPTDSSRSVTSSNSQSRDITQDQEAHAYYNVL